MDKTGAGAKTASFTREQAPTCWHVIDAEGLSLGRLAAFVAHVLRGKHRPEYTPHSDCGDHVVVVKAAGVRLGGGKSSKSADKARRKMHYRHSGYPGGLKAVSYERMLATRPERVVELAVRGMLPRTPLGRRMFRKLKVYSGPEHPHAAQRPQPLTPTR